MSKTFNIVVNGAGQSVQSVQVAEGAGKAGKTVRLKVPPNTKIELLDPGTELAPEGVTVKRVGSELHLAFKGAQIAKPDVVLEDFFTADSASRLVGRQSVGRYYEFVPTGGYEAEYVQNLVDGASSTYDLGGTVTSPWGAAPMASNTAAPLGSGVVDLRTIGLVAGTLALVGLAAGGGGGGGGDTSPGDTIAPLAPQVDPVVTEADGRLRVTGSAEAGTTIVVKFPDGSKGTTVVATDNTFTVISATAQSGGDLTVSAADKAENTSEVVTVTYVDTVAPAVPTLVVSSLADGRAQVTGSAEPKAQVSVTFPDGSVQTAQAGEDGKFALTSAGAQGPGPIRAVATDASGNQSGQAAATLEDTTAPSVGVRILGASDDQAPLTGEISNGGSTNDQTPLLRGEIDTSLGGGDLIRVLRNGAPVGVAQVQGNTWTFQDSLVPQGSASYTVRVEDAVGNAGALSSAFVLVIDTAAPTTPTIDRAITDSGAASSVGAGGTTRDTSPAIEGTLPAALASGESLVILRDGQTVRTFSAAGTGSWVFQDSGLINGQTYTYTAEVRKSTGVASSSNSFKLTVDTAAPTATLAAPTVVDDVNPVTGTVAPGGVSNDASPVVRGSFTGALGTGEKIMVVRTATDGSSIVVMQSTLTNSGWEVSDTGLTDGKTYSYYAYIEDAAGNRTGNSPSVNVSIDTTRPAQTPIITAAQNDSGSGSPSAGNAGSIADTSPTLTGSLSAPLGEGERLELTRGTTKLTATVNGSSWSVADSGLTNGTLYTYTAKVIDAAGNEGSSSTAFRVTVDTSAPTQTASITDAADDVAPNTGPVASGGTTDDSEPLITGSLVGSLTLSDSLQVFRDGTLITTIRPSGSTWSYQEPAALASGVHSYTARVVDSAGNQGPESAAFTLTVAPDEPPFVPPPATVAPTLAIAAADDNVGAQRGALASGDITDDTRPTLQGNLSRGLESGESLVLYRSTNSAALVRVATVPVDEGSTQWSYTDNVGNADNRLYTFVARIEKDSATLAESERFVLKLNTSGSYTGPATATLQLADVLSDAAPEPFLSASSSAASVSSDPYTALGTALDPLR